MIKNKQQNYLPRITWDCMDLGRRGYWIIYATANVPGDDTLTVCSEYHLPHAYAERPQGLAHYVKNLVTEAEISLSHKYGMLVRKHAPKNKHAKAALDTITEWQDKQRGSA